MNQLDPFQTTAPEQYDGNPLAPVRGEAEAKKLTGISAVMSDEPLTAEEAAAYMRAMQRPASKNLGKLLPEYDEAEARARSSDPESSHAAAQRMNDTGTTATHTQRAIDAVWKWPGRSSKELAKLDGTLDRHEFGRRLPDAEAIGEVHRRKVEGKRDLAWFPGRAE